MNQNAALQFALSDLRFGEGDDVDVSMIPPMLRRRLNTLGRQCAAQIMPLLNDDPQLPLVYCSQHGDIQRTFKILSQLAESGTISPKDFSLAVHNAICGVLSIHAGLKGPITTIAAGEDGTVAAILEALGLLNSGFPRVLCLWCDVPLPTPYQSEGCQPEHAFALAVVIEPLGENMFQLQQTTPSSLETNQEPALRLNQFLSDPEAQTLALSNALSHWQLSRLPS